VHRDPKEIARKEKSGGAEERRSGGVELNGLQGEKYAK
jgi:hypothetical protein